KPHDLVGSKPVDPCTIECYRATPGLEQSGSGLEQRGLAGAVASQQRNDLAAIDLEGRAVQDLHAPVAANEVFDFQHACFSNVCSTLARRSAHADCRKARTSSSFISLPRYASITRWSS